jgi:DNA adenine methylase
MRESILTVTPEEISRELRRRCDACGGAVPIVRAAVSMSRGHVRRYCGDRCADADRAKRAYRARTDAVAPPIKWAGGKRWAIQRLRKTYRYHRRARLVEPFAGSLAVALGLRPARAHLSDANPVAARFYALLAAGFVVPDEIRVDRSRETYAENRARFNELTAGGIVDDETAALFYVLVRSAFNGIWRTSRTGAMNSSWGGEGTNIERDLRAYAKIMRGWTFAAGDFADVALERDDFLFVDPPYAGGFVGYAADGFSMRDQRRLATWAGEHEGPVVAMNAATAEMIELYRSHGFRVRRIRAPRKVSSDGDRTGTLELLATKNTSAFDDVGEADTAA